MAPLNTPTKLDSKNSKSTSEIKLDLSSYKSKIEVKSANLFDEKANPFAPGGKFANLEATPVVSVGSGNTNLFGGGALGGGSPASFSTGGGTFGGGVLGGPSQSTPSNTFGGGMLGK